MFTTAPTLARTAVAAFGTVLLAGVCLIGATAPAVAAEPVARTVSYADLDLAHASGRTTFEARIAQAARSVCFNGGREIASQMAYDRCVKDAVTAARASVYPVTASAN